MHFLDERFFFNCLTNFYLPFLNGLPSGNGSHFSMCHQLFIYLPKNVILNNLYLTILSLVSFTPNYILTILCVESYLSSDQPQQPKKQEDRKKCANIPFFAHLDHNCCMCRIESMFCSHIVWLFIRANERRYWVTSKWSSYE